MTDWQNPVVLERLLAIGLFVGGMVIGGLLVWVLWMTMGSVQ